MRFISPPIWAIPSSHARPLKDAGYSTKHFHKTKEAYATAFEECFLTSRHKLVAHVQDFDFGKRIELWNDIEITKVEFFVEGARDLANSRRSRPARI